MQQALFGVAAVWSKSGWVGLALFADDTAIFNPKKSLLNPTPADIIPHQVAIRQVTCPAGNDRLQKGLQV
jgi:hypothetical protein